MMITKSGSQSLLGLFFLACIQSALGQAPVISYAGPQTYTVGTAISPLSPTLSGGGVTAVYGQVSTFAGNLSIGAVNGQALSASFNQPHGAAFDASGNLYVADYSNNLIRKITKAGVVSTFAGSGAIGAANGTGTAASFNGPNAIAISAAGIIYVTDFNNNLIRKITPAGVVTTLAGSGLVGAANGTGAAASFNLPGGIALNAAGTIFITDYGNNLVRKITAAGVVTTVAGSGAAGALNGTGTAASFNLPTGIAIDASGNIYVGDYGNSLIRKVTPAGVVSTFAGSGVPGSVNGKGTAASFNGPYGVSIDAYGYLYIADSNNNQVRVISPAGIVSTLAGSGLNGYADGARATATFNVPFGLAVDASGFIYTTDSNNNEIRKIVTAGYFINPALPPGLSFNNTTGVITGTPSAVAAAADYTITAVNATGRGTADLSVTVVSAAVAANLSALKTSKGALSPVFSPTTTSYTASVANGVASMTVTPTAADPKSTITVNGIAVTSGAASQAIPLVVGENTITIVVTATGGATKKTYTLVVTEAKSSNNNLLSLKPSAGVLSPVFSAATTSYTESVANTVTSVTITPTMVVSTSTVKVRGTAVTSGTASAPIALAVGANTINTVVTSQNGTTKTYTLTVTRAAAPNANLSAYTISAGTLTPAFAAATTSYTAGVANTVTSITVTPTTADPAATVKVRGTAVTSGTASAAIALAVGANTINTVVTASNGATKTYVLTITRATASGDSFDPGISVTQPMETPSLNDDIILVHQGLSPNGDGVNDFLVIDGIQAYPDNKLAIMNRNGQLIYEASGYDNSSKLFDGHSNKNGQMQLPGTYFYQLDYVVKGITKHKTGFLVLKY